VEDQDVVVLDPKGHKEKLPRPPGLSAEAVYDTMEGASGGAGSPSRRTARAAEKAASRRFLWPTSDAVLRTCEVASNTPFQLAAVCAPFATGANSEDVPFSYPGPEGPLRCTRCRCYANPFFRSSSKLQGRLVCNMCGHHPEVPPAYLEELERSGLAGDEDPPEFRFGSVDFEAPASCDADSNAAAAPVACFVIESSFSAVRSGAFRTTLRAIELLLEEENAPRANPGLADRVALVLFDETVSFLAPTKSGGFRTVTAGPPDDPFVPLGADSLFVDAAAEDGRARLRALLGHLCERFDAPGGQAGDAAAGGAALRTAVQAVSAAGGGDVIIFHAGHPSVGIGAIQATAPEGTARGVPQNASFYENTLELCIQGGVAVSTVTAPLHRETPMDLTTLQWLPWRTGGDVLHLPSLGSSEQSAAPVLAQHLRHWAVRMEASAYRCVVKLRCSKGLRCTTLLAPWGPAASAADGSAFELPRLTPDAAVTFVLKPEPDDGDMDEYGRCSYRQELFAQVVVLYTNCNGERLLRVHTAPIGVADSVRAVYQSMSAGPLIAMMLKQAAATVLGRQKPGRKQLTPGDSMLEALLQILVCYRRYCCNGRGALNLLVIEKTLCLLPLYVLSARKLLYSLKGNASTEGLMSPAEADSVLRGILRMPVHSIMAMLYPRVVALPNSHCSPASRGAAGGPAGPCPCLLEHVARGPSQAYLVADGVTVWFCRSRTEPDVHPKSDRQAEEGATREDETALSLEALWRSAQVTSEDRARCASKERPPSRRRCNSGRRDRLVAGGALAERPGHVRGPAARPGAEPQVDAACGIAMSRMGKSEYMAREGACVDPVCRRRGRHGDVCRADDGVTNGGPQGVGAGAPG